MKARTCVQGAQARILLIAQCSIVAVTRVRGFWIQARASRSMFAGGVCGVVCLVVLEGAAGVG